MHNYRSYIPKYHISHAINDVHGSGDKLRPTYKSVLWLKNSTACLLRTSVKCDNIEITLLLG